MYIRKHFRKKADPHTAGCQIRGSRKFKFLHFPYQFSCLFHDRCMADILQRITNSSPPRRMITSLMSNKATNSSANVSGLHHRTYVRKYHLHFKIIYIKHHHPASCIGISGCKVFIDQFFSEKAVIHSGQRIFLGTFLKKFFLQLLPGDISGASYE